MYSRIRLVVSLLVKLIVKVLLLKIIFVFLKEIDVKNNTEHAINTTKKYLNLKKTKTIVNQSSKVLILNVLLTRQQKYVQ